MVGLSRFMFPLYVTILPCFNLGMMATCYMYESGMSIFLQNKGFKGKEGTCILYWWKAIELKVAVRVE